MVQSPLRSCDWSRHPSRMSPGAGPGRTREPPDQAYIQTNALGLHLGDLGETADHCLKRRYLTRRAQICCDSQGPKCPPRVVAPLGTSPCRVSQVPDGTHSGSLKMPGPGSSWKVNKTHRYGVLFGRAAISLAACCRGLKIRSRPFPALTIADTPGKGTH